MSGSIPDSPEQETELLAAEYVLGTLEPTDRAALAREAETDAGLRQSIEAWERRLAPLDCISDPVTPPASLWPRIEASAWGGIAAAPASAPAMPRGAAARDPGSRRLRLWQGAAAAGFALAAGVAGIAVLRPQPQPPAAPLVTALRPLGQQGPVFVAEATPDGGLSVRAVGALHIAPDRDLELWLLKDGEKVPRPLGLLRAEGVHLAAGSVPRGGGARILVSLEPRGGSPTGLPTGPVLYGGSI